LCAYLMKVSSRGHETSRTAHTPVAPIIMCANRPEVLHAPLIRECRADVRIWDITKSEKEIIVGRILASLPKCDVRTLVETHADESIAFFAFIAHRWAEETHNRAIANHGPRKSIQIALNGNWDPEVPAPSLRDLLKIARELVAARQVRQTPFVEEA